MRGSSYKASIMCGKRYERSGIEEQAEGDIIENECAV